jgi:lipooligosaccharide transport system permease protein
MIAAMFTAAFECTFATFIRLEFDKVYDGMLGSPISSEDLIVGEILWAATKGFMFTLSVLVIVVIFGILPLGRMLLVPFLGFLNAAMFATFGLFITSFVKTINHFNFFFSGFISPMLFFSGVVFPLDSLPPAVRPIVEALPLTHPVRLSRAFAFGEFELIHLFDIAYILAFIGIFGLLAVTRLKRRLID